MVFNHAQGRTSTRNKLRVLPIKCNYRNPKGNVLTEKSESLFTLLHNHN